MKRWGLRVGRTESFPPAPVPIGRNFGWFLHGRQAVPCLLRNLQNRAAWQMNLPGQELLGRFSAFLAHSGDPRIVGEGRAIEGEPGCRELADRLDAARA